MKKLLLFFANILLISHLSFISFAQNMGINVPVTLAPLHVSSNHTTPQQVIIRADGDDPNYAVIQVNALSSTATVGYSLLRNSVFFAMMGVNASDDFFIKVGSNAPNAIYAKSSNNFVGINNASPKANLDVNGTVKLGTNGSVFTNIIKATVSIGIISFPANSSNTQTFAIPNAVVGGVVSISPSVALPNGVIIYNARVSSAGNVEVLLRNTTASFISNFSVNCNLAIIL